MRRLRSFDSAGFHGEKTELAGGVRGAPAEAGERLPAVRDARIAACAVGLPEIEQSVGDGLAAAVKHAAFDPHALAGRIAGG